MNIWMIVNGLVWVLCAVFVWLILSDLVKVEKQNHRDNKQETRKMKVEEKTEE